METALMAKEERNVAPETKSKAFILAAGLGSRLKHLTQETPKPLLPVAGVAPAIRTLHLMQAAGFENCVLNSCYLAEKLETEAGSRSPIPVRFSREEKRLETGGGLLKALPMLDDEAILVVNGDVIWAEEERPVLQKIYDQFNPRTMDALLVLVPKENAPTYKGSGDFSATPVGRIVPKGGMPSAPYVYTGIQVISPRLLEGFAPDHCFSLVEAYNKAAQKGRLHGHIYKGEWVDMGTLEGMDAAASLLKRLGAAAS